MTTTTVPDKVFREIAEGIDPIDPEATATNRSFRATVIAAYMAGRAELADLRERFAALAEIEKYIGESCNNASHNIRDVLNGEDPRPDANRWGLEYRSDGTRT